MLRNHEPGENIDPQSNLELERPPLPVSPQDPFQGPRPDSWWTGSSPLKSGCPGLGADGKLHSLRMPNLKSCTRQQVLDYFQNTWALTDFLFASLKSRDAFYSPLYTVCVTRSSSITDIRRSSISTVSDLPARRGDSSGFRGVVSNRRRRNVLGRLAFGRELVARSRASR